VIAAVVAGLVAACGSSTDLIIGRNQSASGNGAGGASAGRGGGGAGSGGAAGSDAVAGLGGVGGLGGEAGAADAGANNCDPLDLAPAGSLVHRYSFDGNASMALDSIGTAHGQLLDAPLPTNICSGAALSAPGAVLDGNGLLVLDGCKGYVNLPNDLTKGLTDITIISWAKWAGGAAFQRYFDFGVGDGEDMSTGQGASFFAVYTAGTENTQLQLSVRQAPNIGVLGIRTFIDMNDKTEHQVAGVFSSNAYVELYRDGERLGHLAITFPLSSISGLNEWIGRSQWISDHPFGGTVNEFRIYDQALSPCAIHALYEKGPDLL
jgi:hypothetical protein